MADITQVPADAVIDELLQQISILHRELAIQNVRVKTLSGPKIESETPQ